MEMQFRFICFGLLIIIGCSDNDITEPPFCSSVLELGNHQLYEISSEFYPYEIGNSVFFVDSIGNSVSFKVEDIFERDLSYTGEIDCPEDTTESVFIEYEGGSKVVRIISNEASFEYGIEILALLRSPATEEQWKEDLFFVKYIGYHDNGFKIGMPIVTIPISSEENAESLVGKDSIMLVDRMFYNVFSGYSEFDGQIIEGYYNNEFGLVGIRDNEGVLWRFDRFE
jgi:hypothetical protein